MNNQEMEGRTTMRTRKIRDEIVLKDDNEIFDTFDDICMPHGGSRRSSRQGYGLTERCEGADVDLLQPNVVMGHFLGSFSKRLIGSQACGAEAYFDKERSSRDNLYDQTDQERRKWPSKYAPKTLVRKSSGIINTRSIVEDCEEELENEGEYSRDNDGSFFIRVRSRASLVSELTDQIRVGGDCSKNRSNMSKERVMTASTPSSVRRPTPLKGPFPPGRPPASLVVGQMTERSAVENAVVPEVAQMENKTFDEKSQRSQISQSSRRPHVARKRQEDACHPPFRVFQGKGAQTTKIQPIDDTLLFPFPQYHALNRPSAIEEESAKGSADEVLEITRKHTSISSEDPSLLPGPAIKLMKPQSMENQTISSNSAASAFVPIQPREAYVSHPLSIRLDPVAADRARLDRKPSGSSGRKSNASDSTPKRKNPVTVARSRSSQSADRSKDGSRMGDRSANGSIPSFLHGDRTFDRVGPSWAPPMIGGLLACTRGNRLERIEAAREEWGHVLVFDPTPASSVNGASLPFSHYNHGDGRKRGDFSPATLITDASPSTLSRASNAGPAEQYAMANKVQESLLVGERKASMKIKRTSGLKPALYRKSDEAACDHAELREAIETNNFESDERDSPALFVSFSEGSILPLPNERIEPITRGGTVDPSIGSDQGTPIPSSCKTKPSHPKQQVKPVAIRSEIRPPVRNKSPMRRGYTPNPRETWRSPQKQKAPPGARLNETISEHVTVDLTSAPSTTMMQSTTTGSVCTAVSQTKPSSKKMGSVYELKRMASRQAYPVFHWQALGIDDTSVGVMSLDY